VLEKRAVGRETIVFLILLDVLQHRFCSLVGLARQVVGVGSLGLLRGCWLLSSSSASVHRRLLFTFASVSRGTVGVEHLVNNVVIVDFPLFGLVGFASHIFPELLGF
jgi:hypothetical protein